MFKIARANKLYSTYNNNIRKKDMIRHLHRRLSMCQGTMLFTRPNK